MRLIEFRSENIKRIKAIALQPDGPVLELSGRNRQGKTSVLDSLYWLLAGTKDIQDDPIREGATHGESSADLGDLIARRTYSRRAEAGKDGKGYTTKLTITPKVGSKVSGLAPQALLDSLIGPLSFDPMTFMKAPEKQQYEMLRKLVKGVDFDAIDKANAADYEARKNHNRDVAQKRAAAAQIVVPAGVPAKPIDDADLLTKMTEAAQINSGIQQESARRERLRDSLTRVTTIIDDSVAETQALRDRIAGLEAETAGYQVDRQRFLSEIDALPPLGELVDVATVSQQITEARRTNHLVADKQRRAALETEAAQIEFLVEDLTNAMDARQQEKRDAIAAADLGVPGLGLGDDRVFLNGHPIRQGSAAEQLQVSLAIAMASNPQLKLVMIRDGNTLDDDSMEVVRKMAADWDGLVIIERVDSSGRVGVVIEDGEVVAVNPSMMAAE